MGSPGFELRQGTAHGVCPFQPRKNSWPWVGPPGLHSHRGSRSVREGGRALQERRAVHSAPRAPRVQEAFDQGSRPASRAERPLQGRTRACTSSAAGHSCVGAQGLQSHRGLGCWRLGSAATGQLAHSLPSFTFPDGVHLLAPVPPAHLLVSPRSVRSLSPAWFTQSPFVMHSTTVYGTYSVPRAVPAVGDTAVDNTDTSAVGGPLLVGEKAWNWK